MNDVQAEPFWEAISGASSYNVEYRVRNSGQPYSPPINTASTTVSLTGLDPVTDYEFIVQAVCADGPGQYSPSGWFTTEQTSVTNCDAPELAMFGTRNRTDVSTEVYWTAVSGADSYNVSFRIRNVGASYSTAINTTIESVILNNLQPSTNYEFIVQSVCGSSEGPFSQSGWFTTLASSAQCEIPVGLSILDITGSTAIVYWNAVTDAGTYSNSVPCNRFFELDYCKHGSPDLYNCESILGNRLRIQGSGKFEHRAKRL